MVGREALLAQAREQPADTAVGGLPTTHLYPVGLQVRWHLPAAFAPRAQSLPGLMHVFPEKCLLLGFSLNLNFTSILGPKEHIKKVF